MFVVVAIAKEFLGVGDERCWFGVTGSVLFGIYC